MLKSMTGFGRARVEAEGMLWTVEVTSVNTRFLDVQMRLPRALAGSEFAFRKQVGEKVARGKVSVVINWEALPDAVGEAKLNQPLAEAYIRQLRQLQTAGNLAGEVTVDTVARLPDLFAAAVESGDKEAREKRLLEALSDALEALDAMRTGEGEKLRSDLVQRIETVRSELQAMEGEAELYAKGLAERVQNRIEQLFSDIGVDPQRLAQEAAFLAERADITEERVRLSAHLDEFERILAKGGEAGRRFGFLLQEMVRETNTIGSKTGELSVIQRVVKIKEELEKIREQVQNLE